MFGEKKKLSTEFLWPVIQTRGVDAVAGLNPTCFSCDSPSCVEELNISRFSSRLVKMRSRVLSLMCFVVANFVYLVLPSCFQKPCFRASLGWNVHRLVKGSAHFSQ